MAAILIGIILLLLIIALAAARKSYAPIQKLVKKYDIKANTIGDNELDQIDSMIESMIQKEEKDGKRIQKQYQLLREQVLCAIVSEGYSPMLQSRLTMLNIRLDGSVFGKIVCDFDHWEEVLEDDGLISAAEELSDEGVEVHAFRTGGGRLTVLVSAEEEYQIEDIQEALASLFEAKGVVAKVKQQGVCHELEQLCNLSGKGEIQGKKNSTEGSRGEEPDREPEIHASEEGGGDSMEDFRKQSATAAYAVKYIDENFTQYDLSLDLVARNLHITSPYLCRLIKQQTGMNYKEYLTRLRMAEAKRLLKNKNASIADVCRQTGYSNVSHFIKTFQKYEGITPAKISGHQIKEESMNQKRPNIVFIMTDQMRGDCLGIAGHPDVKTPFLDSLAANGTLFEKRLFRLPQLYSCQGGASHRPFPGKARAGRVHGSGRIPLSPHDGRGTGQGGVLYPMRRKDACAPAAEPDGISSYRTS